MASNTQLNTGSGGDLITTKERTHDGDATKQQVVSVAFATGSEGSYTHTDAVAGAGAVGAGVQRMTLASDDPAVTALQLLDNAVSGAGFNITQLNGVNVTMGNGASGTGVQRVTLANDSTGVIATVSTVTNVATIGTSVTPGTGAAHLGKAIDTATGATDTGVLLIATRDDALTTLTPVDGDNVQLRTTSTGALWVASANGIAGIADDAAFTPGTSEVLPIGFTFDDASPDSVNEGDIGAARMSANRNIYVTLRDAAGNERGLNVDASGQVAVTLAASQTLGTLTNITNWGNVVDDAAFTPATTRVLMAGFQADETAADSVDEGDAGAARMSLDRKIYAIAHDETSAVYQNGTARTPTFVAISGATNGDNTLLAAAGAGNKIRVLSMYLVAAGTTTVRFESGAGGTALSGAMSLIANTGFVLPYSPVGHFETAANTLLNMELNAAVQVSGGFTYIIAT